MKKKRDIALEIQERRSRLSSAASRWQRVYERLISVGIILDNLQRYTEMVDHGLIDEEEGHPAHEHLLSIARESHEFARQVPVVCVSCIEAYVRGLVSDLISFSDRFRKNAEEFQKDGNIRVDVPILLSIDSEAA